MAKNPDEFDPNDYGEFNPAEYDAKEEEFNINEYTPPVGAGPDQVPLAAAPKFSPTENTLRQTFTGGAPLPRPLTAAVRGTGEAEEQYVAPWGRFLGPAAGAGLEGLRRLTVAPVTAAAGSYLKLMTHPTDLTWKDYPAVAAGRAMLTGEGATGGSMAEEMGLSDVQPDIGSGIKYSGPKGQEEVPLLPSPRTAVAQGINAAADPVTWMGFKAALTPFKLAGRAASGVWKAGEDVAEYLGAKAPKTVGTAVRGVAKGLSEEVGSMTRAELSPELPKYAATAEKAGIDPADLPAGVRYGQGSRMENAESTMFEKPGGAELRELRQGTLDTTKKYVDDQISKISGGPVLDEVSAGEHLKKSYNSAVSQQMADQENSYKTIAGEYYMTPVPEKAGAKLNAVLDEYEAKARAMEEHATVKDPESDNVRHVIQQNKMGENLSTVVAGIRENSRNLGELSRNIKIVGDEAYKVRGFYDAPADSIVLKKMYKDLRQTFIDTVQEIDPDRAAQLVEHNNRMTTLLSNRDLLEDIIKKADTDPAKQFSEIMKGNTSRVKALRQVIGEDNFRPLRGAYLESLGNTTGTGTWNFQGYINALNKNEKFLKEILTPQELADFRDATALGQKIESSKGISTARTSAGQEGHRQFRNIVGSTIDAAANRAYLDLMAQRAGGAAEEAGGLMNGPIVRPVVRQAWRQGLPRYADIQAEEQKRRKTP